jgi:predicted enzyme related to lactoylglutathione lyase
MESTAPSVTGVAFTMYPVSDMPRSIAFYSDVLGLKKGTVEAPFWVEFDVAGATFGIGNFEQVGTPGTAFRTMLAARGVAASEPFETPICWISIVGDPDDNKIVLHQAKTT